MKIINDFTFDCPNNGPFAAQQVFQIFPNVFNDDRGYFTEVLKDIGEWPKSELPLWITQLSWIRQVNRSASQSGTVRGCHAQKGVFCQGKLVEALTEKIYDIIIDARPDSKTFGVSKVYILDPIQQNKLWVPRGFLHSFVVPKSKSTAIFQYFCDNIYNKGAEFGINPLTVLPQLMTLYKQIKDADYYNDLFDVFDNDLVISEKDKQNADYTLWMQSIKDEYNKSNKVWYK